MSKIASKLRKGSLPDYQSLVETAGDVIYTLDFQGRFTYVNRAVMRVMGYKLGELLGTHFAELLTPESRRIAAQHFSRGLQGEESTPFFEVEAVRKNGGRAHLEIRAGSLFRDGLVVGRQGIARDIGELKALQSEVARKSERMALLEEQTRIAMDLYSRIADPEHISRDPALAGRTLKNVQQTLRQATAHDLGLSKSDLIILSLLAQGRSNPEIAGALERSVNTVKDRVKKIMRVLRVRRRAEAVAAATQRGLIGTVTSLRG